MAERDGDGDRAIERAVGAVVAGLTEKDESIGPHGLEMVDRQRLLRSAKQTGSFGDYP